LYEAVASLYDDVEAHGIGGRKEAARRKQRATAPLPVLALFGHAAISGLSLLSEVKRKLDFEPAKGSFWHKADIRQSVHVARREGLQQGRVNARRL
jgi:hypothetical protein